MTDCNALRATYSPDGETVTSETRCGRTTLFSYDGCHRLIRVDDPAENATWRYCYDERGNLTAKTRHMFTIGTPGAAREVIRLLYAGDRLCAYGDQPLVYSAAGELAEAGGWRYEWKSRRLSSMRTDGKTLTFRCNASGQRLQKRMDASWFPVITSYSWRQGRLAQMVIARTGYDEIERKTTLRYSYDERGCPERVEYNGTAYTCLCDSAGSVVALLDGSGETAVSYDYDAWGRQLAVSGRLADTLGADNPVRFRGMLYDPETGLYDNGGVPYYPEYGRYLTEPYVFSGNNPHIPRR